MKEKFGKGEMNSNKNSKVSGNFPIKNCITRQILI